MRQMTNEFNELLYDESIPRLFRQLYDLDESQQTEEHEVELIKMPPTGYCEVTAAKDKIVRMGEASSRTMSVPRASTSTPIASTQAPRANCSGTSCASSE